jgi:Ca-activated chloride channel family protein
MTRLLLAISTLLLFAPVVRPVSAADTPGEGRPRRVTSGTLLWRVAGEGELVPAPALDTHVNLRLTGMVARATVRQEFTNPAAAWAEGVYVFPLPEDAAVDHLRMRVGDRVIEGQIRERAAAKAEYEQAKQQGRRASLVEQERPNIFTTSIANIPPGVAITVEIEYQQVVAYEAGQYRLRFPMVVGPRYIPGEPVSATGTGWAWDTDEVPDASRITPPVAHPSRGPINPVTLRIELDPGVPLARLESSYHAIQTAPLAGGKTLVELAQGPVPADRDFELVWQPATDVGPIAALFAERRGDETFALLMVMPPALTALAAARVPREVVFVIDNSGSMAGASMDQAKAALTMALGRLGPADAFNVIRFNHTTDAVFGGALPATPLNRRAAAQWVAALRANGGTEMLPALQRALDQQEHPGRLRQVVFLTDGAVGNEERLFGVIRERLGDRHLFTIGIGSAPNSHFMREAARLGRGTFTFIGNPTEVQEKMNALFRKLESPALTDLRIELPAGAQAMLLPERIPDLYAGEPVVLTLKARALPPVVTLRGNLGGTPWQRDVALHAAEPGAGLSAHWGRTQIAALLDRRHAGASEDDTRTAVVRVALEHHLVSAYTSLVAVDVTPVRPGDAELHSHALKTNLPHGWDYQAVFGMGQGATPGPLHVVVGLAALLVATLIYVYVRLGCV